MNEFKPVLLLARKSLIALAAVVLLCVIAVVGLGQLADKLQTTLAQQQAALQDQQALLVSKQTDLANVREHIASYQALRDQGLVGEPDRALWVEQLQSSHSKAQLPDGLSVQLQAPKQLVGSGAPPAGEPDPAQPEPLMHDLQFELRNVVESEVFSLVRDFRAQTKGRFRVNACKLFEARDTGLTAQCVMRFITVPAGVPAAVLPQPGAAS